MTQVMTNEAVQDRRWGFGLALAAHAALFIVGSLAWQHRAEYGMDASQGAVDVELVAAPAASAPQITAVTPPAPIVAPDLNDVVQPMKAPLAPPVPPTPTPVAAAPAPSAAVGDGSAPIAGADATTLHRMVGGETMAKPGYQRNPPPAYPAEARRLKQEGRVLLNVSVTAEGRVAAAVIKQSSGFPLLDDAALRGVQNWRFRAASVGGLRVASDVEIPIRFQLK